MLKSSGNADSPLRHARGVAAIEFVIVLPVLLFLFFGMINVTQFISMNHRINTAAELVADLVTRHSDSIAAATIDDYFTAVALAVRPVDSSVVRVDLYDFYWSVKASRLRWSKSSNTGTPCTAPTVDDSDTNDPIVSLIKNGDDVVVAVVCMPFVAPSAYPGLDTMFQGLTIEKRVILKPRQSQTLICTPVTPKNCP